MGDITIIGGGLSGLAAAYFLTKKLRSGDTLTLIEKEARVGGWIETDILGGQLFERAARGFLSYGKGASTLELVSELELEPQLLHATRKSRQRYLFSHGELMALPSNFWSWLLKPSWWWSLRALFAERNRPPAHREDETIADFFARRFGKKVLDLFIDPLVSGIFAGDPYQLSIRSCFPHFYRWEQEYGSLWRGMSAAKRARKNRSAPGLYSFREGMGTLIKALEKQLRKEGVKFKLSTAVTKIDKESGGFQIDLTAEGKASSQQADEIVWALPSESLTQLLPALTPLFPQPPTASIVSVHFVFSAEAAVPQGFGYLIPSREGERVLGSIFNSSIFPEQNREGKKRVTVMLGGIRHPEVVDWSSSDLIAEARSALHRHLSLSQEPEQTFVQRAPHAITQYTLGHAARLASLEAEIEITLPGLYLAGSSFYGVGVNDCIARGKELAHIMRPV